MKSSALPNLLLALCLAAGTQASAQEISYKEHLRLAERFLALGEHLKAAEQYADAYLMKPRKDELAFAAAEEFYLVKDYTRAAAHYEPIVREWKDYPLAGLRYARSLKQDGEFDRATAAYLEYLSFYRGADLPILKAIVETEVKGAEMARQALRSFNPDVIVEPFGTSINEPSNEMAPMPLSAETLYFLSDRRGPMRMYRSFEAGGNWQPAEAADQFPIVAGRHIGPGTLSPLQDRFYFSLCDEKEVMTQPTALCKIYVIQRSGGSWSTPQPLPSYINTEDNSTSHPYVYRDGEQEVMLFASNRLDGYGGMDLYRSERYLNSGALDFSFPQNLGPVVNGVGDEVSPFYNPTTQTLFFASNGNLNLGGYDIFSTQGGRAGFNVPKNVGAPINSSADDYYYREIPASGNAVLSSNRAIRDAKTRTNNEDLYLVRPGTPTLPLSLQVVDSTSELGLGDVMLAAFTNEPSGGRKLITTARSNDGFFSVELPMGTEVTLDIRREDYKPVERTVTIPRSRKEGFQLPRIRMQRIVVTLADVQQIENSRTTPPAAKVPTTPAGSTKPPPASKAAPSAPTSGTPPSITPATTPAATPPSGTPPVTTPPTTTPPSPSVPSVTPPAAKPGGNASVLPPAPTPAPTPTSEPDPVTASAPSPIAPVRAPAREYRIQLEARAEFEPYHRRYEGLGRVGELSMDYISDKNLYRILVGRYGTLPEATAALGGVQSAGFPNAYVVAFDFGTYRGMARN